MNKLLLKTSYLIFLNKFRVAHKDVSLCTFYI